MPKEVFGRGYQFMDREELLTFEELERLARAFVGLGVEKIRITGGEPLLRRDLERLIERLAAIDGLDLTLTTNGALLPQKAAGARGSRAPPGHGQPRLARRRDLPGDERRRLPGRAVLEGIDAAAAAGLPVKVNAVVKRGLNDGEIVPLARHFRDTGHTLRFIEYMDVGRDERLAPRRRRPRCRDPGRVDAEFPLEPVESAYRGEVARRYRYRDGAGEVGIIASVTQPFCGDCTRARISAEGRLYTCLFAVRGHDLRALVRVGRRATTRSREAISAIWTRRADRYSEIRSERTIDLPRVEMSYIGG